MDFTGERFTPECIREIRYEHFHRYALVTEWIAGLKVLDAACGEGYGSHLLASLGAKVSGVDISGEAISHAQSRYGLENIEFLVADCCAMPFANHSFDCVISFETLEHLQNQEALLAEFKRVLKPTGFLVISTPDRAVYSGRLGNQNPYHVGELLRAEFESLLAGHFREVRLLGQKLGFHSMIWPLQEEAQAQSPAPSQASSQAAYRLQQESAAGIKSLSQPVAEPVYLLAICADSLADFPDLRQGLFLFDDESESVYQHYRHEIRRNLATGAILQELEDRVASLQAQLTAAMNRSGGAEQTSTDQTRADQTSADPAGAAQHWLRRVLQKLKA